MNDQRVINTKHTNTGDEQKIRDFLNFFWVTNENLPE